ncbi:MAG: acyl-ACP--UDP-N-acetylglucosamine O-acyltransferase [Phycisphaerales bacterium]|nr:acyl-ACP--UDP-N-acetylglucosamine O-acyltransferase [Phycisphaerales bacterium]
MAKIHPTAIVPPEAVLADDVEIGPFCVLTGRVTLGPGVRLLASVHVQGPATIGEGTIVYPGACLGFEPQDYKFKPGALTAGVCVGANCLIREHVTIHAASNDHTPTTLGDGCFLMAYSHMGHDCRVGNRVILVNYCGLSGHVEVQDNATLSGHVGVHQFVRIGRLAFLSGGASVGMDVPPFCMANERNRLGGLNLVGMRRTGSAARRSRRSAGPSATCSGAPSPRMRCWRSSTNAARPRPPSPRSPTLCAGPGGDLPRHGPPAAGAHDVAPAPPAGRDRRL